MAGIEATGDGLEACAMTGNDKLADLLRQAASHKMTPREIWDQRVSFVHGQMMDCAPATTREEVERCAVENYGPRP